MAAVTLNVFLTRYKTYVTLNHSQSKSWLYRQYARLAEHAGVRNFRVLTLTGLDKEIIRIEKIQNIS